MKIVTSQEMKLIDQRASSQFGISSVTLMENAGKAVAALVPAEAQKVLVFCGKGNNGGDGFVAARYLAQAGKSVAVVLLADPDELKGEARINYESAMAMGVRIAQIASSPQAPRNDEQGQRSVNSVIASEAKQSDFCPGFDLIIDAIFGIGLNTRVTGIYRETIDWINQEGKPVLAVDVPSGLNADTGDVMGIAVKAWMTGALGLPKQGLYKGFGPQYCGQVKVLDIGLPAELLA